MSGVRKSAVKKPAVKKTVRKVAAKKADEGLGVKTEEVVEEIVEPVAAEPAAEAPVAEAPAAEAPAESAVEPVAEAPAEETPAVEAPAEESAVTEAPAAEEPAAAAEPAAEEPAEKPAKKAPAKRMTARKTTTRKTAAKKPETPAEETPSAEAPIVEEPAETSAAVETAAVEPAEKPAKKAPAKRTTARKTTTRKTAAKKPETPAEETPSAEAPIVEEPAETSAAVETAAEEPAEKPAKKAPSKRTAAKKADDAETPVEKKPAAKRTRKKAAEAPAETPVEAVQEVTPHTVIYTQEVMDLTESYYEEPKLKVLLAGSECVPFAKTGGLADVLGTLPQALNGLNVDARVIIPFHRQAKEKYRMQTRHVTDFYIYLGWRSMFVGIDALELNGVTYYLIDNEDMFGGPIYKGGLPEGEQYAFFARAVCEALDRIDFMPDVLHCNDWQCGMIPMLLKTQYPHRPQSRCKTVFSIHNLMYQGQYSFEQVKEWFGIEDKYNTPEFIEHYGCASFMKAGLVFCDRISTVSPTYAQEIKLPYFSYGLEGILNARSHETWGILNGMDRDVYDPMTDPKIPYHFNVDDQTGKQQDKEALIQELGLNIDPNTPIIGMVGRLTHQKGLNLLLPIFDELMRENVALIILGTGDAEYENFFRGMEAVYRGRVCAYIGYSDDVAHRVYAGSDLFLMPSKFEPCGISQMIALRYGTLPIVRETGGLKDTVIPFNEFTGEGNGFSFTNYSAHDMLSVIRYALHTIQDMDKKNALRKSAFAADFSFAKSAGIYRDMYKSLL